MTGRAGIGTAISTSIGIAINAADEIFVIDFYNRVQKFSVDGKLSPIPTPPNPGGIAFSRLVIYLAHFENDQVSVYDSTGKLLSQVGTGRT